MTLPREVIASRSPFQTRPSQAGRFWRNAETGTCGIFFIPRACRATLQNDSVPVDATIRVFQLEMKRGTGGVRQSAGSMLVVGFGVMIAALKLLLR
jgi:hypothetical protein